MKRMISLLCVFAVMFSLSACDSPLSDTDSYENIKVEIYNNTDYIIGEIEFRGVIYLLGDKIIYAQVPKHDISSLEIYSHDINDNNDEFLGKIKNFGTIMNGRTLCYNDHLYMLVSLGDPFTNGVSESAVFDIDPVNKSVTKIFNKEKGFIYDTLSIVNGKLLITHLNGNICNTVEEYDIETKETRTVIYENNESGNIIRITSSDENGIYILRVLYKNDYTEKQLFLDTYDFDYNLKNTIELDDIFDPEEQKLFNETDQVVINFKVQNGYMYYDNLSTAHFLGKLEENSVKNLVPELGYSFKTAVNVYSNDTYFMIHTVPDNTSTSTSSIIYLLDSTDGSLKKSDFPKKDGYSLHSIYKSDDDHILINTRNNDDKTLPMKAYYMNISDLDFEEISTD